MQKICPHTRDPNNPAKSLDLAGVPEPSTVPHTSVPRIFPGKAQSFWSSDTREIKRERGNSDKKKRGHYCRHGRAAKETQAPSEGILETPRALFGIDRDWVKGLGGVTFWELIGGALACTKSGRFSFWACEDVKVHAEGKHCHHPREVLPSAMLTTHGKNPSFTSFGC